MKVLYAASEANPFMASGGLGDVAGSLPIALRKRLIGCRVVMPLYDSIKQEYKDKMKFITPFPCLLAGEGSIAVFLKQKSTA